MFSIKIIKKYAKLVFLLNSLIKNVFATFFVKTIKKHSNIITRLCSNINNH
jgi:hypothetical protein